MHPVRAAQLHQSATCLTAAQARAVVPRSLTAKAVRKQAFRQIRSALVVTVRAELGHDQERKVTTGPFEELQSHGFDSSSSSTSHLQRANNQHDKLAQREEQLWQRQEALWQQQLAHWQHERSVWAQREAALLATVQDLHALLTTVSTRHIQGNPQPSQETQSLSRAQPQHLSAPQATLPDEDVPKAAAVESLISSDNQQSPSSRISVPLDDSEPADASVQSGKAEASSADSDGQLPTGPPPQISLGNDDIYWVHQLQSGLVEQGYYCGEEEMEDFIFGSGTESAVLSFQASKGLEESGVANDATWQALLGNKLQPAAPPVDEEALEETPELPRNAPPPSAPTTPKQKSQAKDPHPWQASWGDLFGSEESDIECDTDSRLNSSSSTSTSSTSSSSSNTNSNSSSITGGSSSSSSSSVTGSSVDGISSAVVDQITEPKVVERSASPAQASAASPTAAAASTSGQWKPYVNEEKDYSKWTVLREGDGGRHVHELQTALVQQGFWPGEDDMTWWQFGSDTCSAVQTFQATANLPESGVVTSDTWQALLGPNATPADARLLAMENATDDDMTADHEGMVYLVGEQRWARKIGV